MTDEQPPIAPQDPPQPPYEPPPPPSHGPFAFPPPPEPAATYRGPHSSAARGFYPLDFDAITRTAWSVFRFAWPTFLGAALIPNLVVYALLIPLQAIVAPRFTQWVLAYREAVVTGQLPTLPADLLPSLLLLVLVTVLGAVVGGLIVGGAVMTIGDSVFRGRPVTVRSALLVGLRRLPALLGAGVVVMLTVFGVLLLGIAFAAVFFAGGGAAIFLGLIVFVAAFFALIFVSLRWALLVQTVVLEDKGPVDGLSRSWRLVAGSGWRVLGYVLFIALLGGVVGAIVGLLPSSLLHVSDSTSAGAVVGTILEGVLAVLLAPTALVMLFLYYDLRFKAGEPAPQPGEDRRVA